MDNAPTAPLRRRNRVAPVIAEFDIRLLRVFLTVADCGGFAASEVRLNKSKSAISLDISKLEDRLGMRLCERGRAGFSLTAYGQEVHDAARAMIDDLERFSERLVLAAGEVTGAVRLMVLDNIGSIAARPMVEALRTFRIRYPKVRLSISSGDASTVEQHVLDGRAHIGITLLPRQVPELSVAPLFFEELQLYCGSRHPLFRRSDADIDVDRLVQHSLCPLSVADDPGFTRLIDRFGRGAQASNLDCLILVILAGVDLGFLPPHYARPWVDRGEIRPIRPDIIRTRNLFHIIGSRGARPVAASALFDVLAEAFRRIPVGVQIDSSVPD